MTYRLQTEDRIFTVYGRHVVLTAVRITVRNVAYSSNPA